VAVAASAVLGIVALWVLVPTNRIYAITATIVAIARLRVLPSAGAAEIAGDLAAERGHAGPRALLRRWPQRQRGDGHPGWRPRAAHQWTARALIDTAGSAPRFSGEYWLSPLAVIARPQAQDMLVVGFGGGVVIEATPPAYGASTSSSSSRR
jgi:hypothetical protein